MAVEFTNIGSHKNVYTVLFGDRDVIISTAKDLKQRRVMVMFHNVDDSLKPEDIQGRYTDDLPVPDAVLMFEDPETIGTLIQQLCEIQKEFF